MEYVTSDRKKQVIEAISYQLNGRLIANPRDYSVVFRAFYVVGGERVAQTLAEMYDREKKSQPIKLVRSRVAAKASVLLFRELVKTLNLDLQ